MSSLAGDSRWFLWLPDDRQYMDIGINHIEEIACLPIWWRQRSHFTCIDDSHHGKCAMDSWVRRCSLCYRDLVRLMDWQLGLALEKKQGQRRIGMRFTTK